MHGAKDLAGMRFGKLIAVEPTDKREKHYIVWRCKCDCGNECFVDSKRLQRGTITDCGCVPKTKQYGKLLDLTDQVFGSLTAIRRVENKKDRTAWLCRCECGNEVVVCTHDLRAGHTKSCGCKAHSNSYYRDLTGQRIGYLTVIKKTEQRDYKGSILWKCHCDCGKDVLYSADSLLHGGIKSCGCYRENEILKKICEKPHRIDGTCIERLNLQKARSDSKSGYVGIHKINENCYRAMINFKGKRHQLGNFTNLEDAINARQCGAQIHRDFLDWYYQEYAECLHK